MHIQTVCNKDDIWFSSRQFCAIFVGNLHSLGNFYSKLTKTTSKITNHSSHNTVKKRLGNDKNLLFVLRVIVHKNIVMREKNNKKN